MSDVEKKPGYLISYVKQTSMLGESVQISTNLPEGASEHDIYKEVTKLGNALHLRMLDMNAQVLEKTGKNLQDMGIESGTIFKKDESE